MKAENQDMPAFVFVTANEYMIEPMKQVPDITVKLSDMNRDRLQAIYNVLTTIDADKTTK